jgi:hypothetical protein
MSRSFAYVTTGLTTLKHGHFWILYYQVDRILIHSKFTGPRDPGICRRDRWEITASKDFERSHVDQIRMKQGPLTTGQNNHQLYSKISGGYQYPTEATSAGLCLPTDPHHYFWRIVTQFGFLRGFVLACPRASSDTQTDCFTEMILSYHTDSK